MGSIIAIQLTRMSGINHMLQARKNGISKKKARKNGLSI